MRKVPTLFVRDPDNMSRVLNEVNPAAAWVLDGNGAATRKYDGTPVMLDDDSRWWARREVKPEKKPPAGFEAVETDLITGKTVGWEPIEQSPFVKFWREALGNPYERRRIGTYELLGPKVNGNPENVGGHVLWWHNDAEILKDVPLDYDGLAEYLRDFKGEGVVWHEGVRSAADVMREGARMAKLKRRDFGYT